MLSHRALTIGLRLVPVWISAAYRVGDRDQNRGQISQLEIGINVTTETGRDKNRNMSVSIFGNTSDNIDQRRDI